MRGPLDSTLNRLVLTYGVGLLLAFIAIGAVSLLAFDRLAERDSERTVRVEHQGLMEVYRAEGRQGLRRTIATRVREPVNSESVYLLVDADGRISAGHRSDLPVNLPRHSGWLRFPWRAAPESDDVLAYAQALPLGGWLVTGHTTGEQERLRELIQRLGLVMLTLLAALTLLLGWLLRDAVDRALEAALDTVDRVAAGRLSERVPDRAGDDGFARLGRTLNRMLDRIDVLVGGIRSSTDAIAHDLRTPLTRLRTRLEQARLDTQEPAAHARIDAAVLDADQLMATFNSLLRLARIESAQDDPAGIVALDLVAGDAVEMWQVVAEAQEQAISTAIEPVAVIGDRDLLFQLLSNLLDNAIKYSAHGGRIRVEVGHCDGRARLLIADEGPGIAAELRQHVFDRFVRGESHRGTPGTGLGLSVVRAIAIHHHADLRLEDAQPGLRVQLLFPLA